MAKPTATAPKQNGEPEPFVPVDVQEAAPKRGPGRPRMSDEERAAKGLPPRGERQPRRAAASLEIRIGAMLTQLNFFAVIMPFTRNDALDQAEIIMLARAIDEQCKTSTRFRKYVEMALGAGSGGQLLVVGMMIGARRAARHGMIPVAIDDAIGIQLAGMAKVEPTPSPVIERPKPEQEPETMDQVTEPTPQLVGFQP